MKRSSLYVLRSDAAQPLLLVAQQILGNVLDAEEVVANVISALVPAPVTRKKLDAVGSLVEEVLVACNERLGMAACGRWNRPDNDVEDEEDGDGDPASEVSRSANDNGWTP